MKQVKEFLTKSFKAYLIYVFIFAVLVFAIQKPGIKTHIEVFSEKGYNLESINKDRVALIESGEHGALVRLNLIENAQKNIEVSYYTLIQGTSTDILLASLLDAADRGVEVRILLDGLFHNLKGSLKDAIYGFKLHPKIRLKFYEPLNILAPLAWNNRLHDKIIIVDEKLALIGGRNIGDKYFLEDIKKGNFVKDRDVIIFKEGTEDNDPSVILGMKNYYNNVWNHEYSKPAIKKLTPKQKSRGERFNEKLRYGYIEFKEKYLIENKKIDWYAKTIPTESIKFIHNPIGRANQDPWCLRELLNLSAQAEKTIFVQSPYIILSRNMKSKFNQYDIDLEKVSILTNSFSSSPNPLAISGYSNNRKSIVDSGAELYEYQGPDSLHGKTYIFDERISVIGSFNIDARSSYINSESMVIISSEEFADKLKENIQVDLNNSLKVDKDYSYIYDNNIEEGKVPIYTKVIIILLSKIVWFLDYLL